MCWALQTPTSLKFLFVSVWQRQEALSVTQDDACVSSDWCKNIVPCLCQFCIPRAPFAYWYVVIAVCLQWVITGISQCLAHHSALTKGSRLQIAALRTRTLRVQKPPPSHLAWSLWKCPQEFDVEDHVNFWPRTKDMLLCSRQILPIVLSVGRQDHKTYLFIGTLTIDKGVLGCLWLQLSPRQHWALSLWVPGALACTYLQHLLLSRNMVQAAYMQGNLFKPNLRWVSLLLQCMPTSIIC